VEDQGYFLHDEVVTSIIESITLSQNSSCTNVRCLQ